jgi:hypothetical protein
VCKSDITQANKIKEIKENQRKKLTNEEEGNKPSIYFVRPIPSDLD